MAVESAVITVKESWKGETCQVIIHFTVSRIEGDISLDGRWAYERVASSLGVTYREETSFSGVGEGSRGEWCFFFK